MSSDNRALCQHHQILSASLEIWSVGQATGFTVHYVAQNLVSLVKKEDIVAIKRKLVAHEGQSSYS